MIENEQEFRDWCRKNGLKEKPVKNYISWLNMASRRINEDITPSTLSSEADIDKMISSLMQHPDMSEIHGRRAQDTKAAMRMYVKMCSRNDKTTKHMTLEEQLHQEMLNLYSRAGKETGYWGNYYLRSVKKNGGLATARKMLIPKENQKIDKGLQALIDAGRADELSVEAIALRHEFRPLFTVAEVAEATKRLAVLSPASIKSTILPESIFPEVLPDLNSYSEGAVRSILVNAYERDTKARAACLAKHGRRCAVCAISFEEQYGEIGKGFIHVHHKKPLAAIRCEYKINPKIDLVPVCPNCHAMLHSSNPPLAVETLKSIYESRRLKSKTK